MRQVLIGFLASVMGLLPAGVRAQQPPPQQYPAQQYPAQQYPAQPYPQQPYPQQPPPGYVYPPPQYAQPYPYAAPPSWSPEQVAARSRQRTKRVLMGVGGGLLGGGYFPMLLTSIVCFGVYNNSCGWESLIPVAGPFVLAADVARSSYYGSSGLATAFLVFDGLLQTAGLTLLIVGAALPQKTAPQVSLAPMLTPGGSGLSLAGRF